MKKNIIKATLFTTIFALLCVLTSYILLPKENIKESFDNHGRDYNKIPILENSALRTFIKGKYGGRYIDV